LLTVAYAVLFPFVPLASRRVVQQIESGAGLDAVRDAALVLIGLGVVVAAARFASRFLMFRAARQIEFEVRGDLCAHLQRLPQSYFASNRTGDLMSRAVNDVNNLRMFLGMGVMNLFQTPILYLTTISAMLWLDWRVALCVLVPYVAFVGIARAFGRHLHAASLAVQEQLGALSAVVQENASGVLVVRSYAMESSEGMRFGRENDDLYRKQVRLAKIDAGMQPVIAMMPTLSQILLVMIGGYAVIAGRMTIADFVAFYLFIVQLTFPTFMLGFVIAMAQRGLVALDRLGEVMDTIPSIRDRTDVEPMDAIRGSVEVRNLTLGYGDDLREPALRDVSFKVEAGQTVGIVGAVGAGKSTLVNAIPQLLEVPRDTVLIDDVDVMRVPLNLLRRSIAMVPQDSFLFSTTIAENIAFGMTDATPEQVLEAAGRADIRQEIEDLPFGFDTVVGERGITLSGGQRQRVALARALILRPSILILDDALSSVDAATEESILKQLRSARFGRTCFIVAHRISAVRDADQILVLENGRLIERGRHDELMKLEGFYAKLARRQQLEAELERDFPREEAV
jgi:ATP-binding cassette subfamily B protein